MQSMPSSQFRKSYGKLTEPTIVTVNGHAIGTWYPGRSGGGPVGADSTFTVGEHGPETLVMGEGATGYVIPNVRFTPVPKPGRKR